MASRQRVKGLLARFRRELPTIYPVRLFWRQIDCQGLCNLDKKKRRFNITLNPDVPDVWIEILIHEYAHALHWTHDKLPDHCPGWGVEYARVYRCYVNEKG